MEENNNENVINSEKTKNNQGLIIGIVIVAIIVLVAGGYFLFSKGIVGGNVKNVVGYYELYEMSSGEESYTYDELQSLKNLGLVVTLELNEDKTGELNLFGETMELKYDNKNMTVDGESSPYTAKDDKISMEHDDEKLVFQKTEKYENTNNVE